MQVVRKSVAVALAAVLLLMAAIPVPFGVRAIDHMRIRQADANPAVATYAVWGTALAACGIYAVGSSLEAYQTNLTQMYTDFSAYAGYTSSELETMLQDAVTPGGAVDLSGLQSLYPDIQGFAASYLSQGNAVTGASSIAGMSGAIYFGQYGFVSESGTPGGYDKACQQIAKYPNDYPGYVYYGRTKPTSTTNSSGLTTTEMTLFFTAEGANFYVSATSPPAIKTKGTRTAAVQVYLYSDGRNPAASAPTYNYTYGLPNDNVVLYQGYTFTSQDWVVSNGFVANATAVVEQALVNGTAAAPTATVDVFEPTAAQLEAGYSSADIIDAINAGNATTEGIAGYLEQHLPFLGSIFNTLTAMAADLTAIVTDWASIAAQPFSWLASWWQTLSGWWADLLDWVGDTPFGTVMGTVIDGVQSIPGTITDVGAAVLDGLRAIPGALQGVLEGILDGVLSIPASIAAVIEAIQTAVMDLVGAIEGILNFQLPTFGGDGTPIEMPPFVEQAQIDIANKVPFCYVIRTATALGSMFSNFNSNRSFVFDLPLPFSNEVLHFDGEPVLSQPLGASDIAGTIRALVTSVLCVGLLMRAYKILERSSGGI